ncbi:MAG: hypothetical protein V4515_08300 [Chloroflexota bacterium]
MSDQPQGDTIPQSDGPKCPWCSVPLASVDDARCPSCNATLRESTDEEVPGVTRVDHEALFRPRTSPARSAGLIGWLAGSKPEDPEPQPSPSTFSPPDADVRREMLRMELAAIEAKLDAQRAELESELGVTAPAVEPAEPDDPIEGTTDENQVPPPA